MVEASQETSPLKFYGIKDAYGEFSNFYAAKFTLDGKTWPTTEHYFQAQKFVGIDESYLEKVRTSKSPGESKRIARAGDVQRRADWQDVKYGVMVKALQAKFKQHPDLGKLLLGTGNRELIENAMNDYTWGCGKDGTGKNWLGKALMEVREWLRKELAKENKN